MPDDPRRWIDLHLHSTASDGAYLPAKLIEMASLRRLCAVSLTDHDTVAGLSEAASAAGARGLEFVPGIELATDYARGTLHILGYFVDPLSAALREALAEAQRGRHTRNEAIIARLADQGVHLDYKAVLGAAGSSAPGRPHIAQAMIRAGVVANHHAAFAKYLGRGAAAWVARETFTPERAIDVIRRAGGVAALAHPCQLGYASELELETILRRLCDAGLGAIEVHHPGHSNQQTRLYLGMAARFGLATTGGSDFHALGAAPRGGAGFARVRVPYAFLETLRKRAGR